MAVARGRLIERALPGLNDYVYDLIPRRGRVLDLGAGTGALTQRLHDAGRSVVAVDLDEEHWAADVPLVPLDLDGDSVTTLDAPFDVILAVEVIEHLENPIAFLRNIAHLLTPSGTAIVTSPNVDSLPARLKFLLKGKLRALDEHGDPTHISPLVWDLFITKWLHRAGLTLAERRCFPERGFAGGRPLYSRVANVLARVSPSTLDGDIHVLLLRRSDGAGGRRHALRA